MISAPSSASARFSPRLAAALLSIGLGFALGAFAAGDAYRMYVGGAAACFMILACWLVSPELTVLGYIAARPLVDAVVYQSVGALSLGQVWGAGLVVLCCGYICLVPAATSEGRGLARTPLVVLVCYAALTFTRSDIGNAIDTWMKLASWLLMVLVVGRIAETRRGQSRTVLSMYIFSVLLVFVVVYLASTNKYGTYYYSRVWGQPFNSLGQDPHGLAAMAVMVLPFVFFYVLAARYQIFSLIVAGLLGSCVVLSFVRSAYVGFLVIAVAFFAISMTSRRYGVRAIALSTIALAGLAAYLGRSIFLGRVGSVSEFLQGGSSANLATAGRLDFYRAILGYSDSGLSHLLIGGGAGTSVRVIGEATGMSLVAHNDALEMLATGGVVLLAVYCLLIAWMVWVPLSVCRDATQSKVVREFAGVATAAVFAYAAMSLVDGMVFYAPSSLAMGVLLGLMLGIGRAPRRTAMDELAHEEQLIPG